MTIKVKITLMIKPGLLVVCMHLPEILGMIHPYV